MNHRSRSKMSKRSKRSKMSKRSKQWITRPGKLGGPGFLTKPLEEQHALIDKCKDEYGYRSCLGSIQVLNRNRAIAKKHSAKINELANYLKSKSVKDY